MDSIPAQSTPAQPKEPAVRLTERDRDLLAHVAVARYLTLAQIKRLVFQHPANAKSAARGLAKPPSDQVCRRRLALLSGAYLRKLGYRDQQGVPVAVCAVTPRGHAIACEALRRSVPIAAQDVRPQFLAHTIALNELYVELAVAAGKLGVRPASFPFRWVATETGGLPWRERDMRTGQVEERRLVPDAILEAPAEQTRVFLECEMGGHPLARREESALGSVRSKLQRYAAFMQEGGQTTFYAQRFADGWKAELVFLVHSEQRAANAAALIEEWRGQNRALQLTVRALSFDRMAAHYLARLRLPAAPEAGVMLSAADVRLACSFVSEVLGTYKLVRHYLRANPEVRAKGCPYPEYSTDFEAMVALAERLRRRERGGEVANARA
jgi:hypothetical protein